jgi:hypothetical protein
MDIPDAFIEFKRSPEMSASFACICNAAPDCFLFSNILSGKSAVISENDTCSSKVTIRISMVFNQCKEMKVKAGHQ